MSETSYGCRRRAARTESALTVRFTVNGGPEHFSDTLNFSSRSLAIRTDLPVKVGDCVRAAIEYFPPLEGAVVRVWAEGFAVALNEATLTPEALARGSGEADGARDGVDLASALADGPVAGRLTRMEAPHPCWFSITRAGLPPSPQPRLLLITTAPLARDTICSTWISVAGTRWLARAIDAQRRDGRSILILRINDWQLQKAAEFGLTFTAIMKSLEEWTAKASPEAVESHLAALSANAA